MSASDINCNLCIKPFGSDQIVEIGKCNHVMCKECFVGFITKNLKARIKCPIGNCDQSIKDSVIRKCLSDQQILMYEKMSISSCYKNVGKCPAPCCQYMFVHEDNVGIFDCSYCGSPICIKCNDIHYPNDCGKTNTNNNALIDRAKEKIHDKKRIEFVERDKKYDLMPNPDCFECSFCSDFVLPKSGVILRNCLHCFCRNCLKETYSNKNYANQFKCQVCNVKLQNKELRVLIEEKRFTAMVIKEAKYLFYQCKHENCTGLWDVTSDETFYRCAICMKINCLDCNDIHEGQTCEMFKMTQRFKANKIDFKSIIEVHVNCLNCKQLLIQKDGCGDLHCSNCGNHVCVFTGLFSGTHDPKKCGCYTRGSCEKEGKYCNCSPAKTCDDRCKFGCIADD